MDIALFTDLARETLVLAIKIVAPALLVGMAVGLFISLFQAVTSIQEQTLTLVPKMLAVAGMLLLLLPWTLTILLDFATSLFSNLSSFVGFPG
ncbi:MAG TPA: flagellar type III secretion system protein FliQ [Planctomycetes bacterium]|nr:flagellar type III secretion system protein FliQ [Planctomycetota bacterium]